MTGATCPSSKNDSDERWDSVQQGRWFQSQRRRHPPLPLTGSEEFSCAFCRLLRAHIQLFHLSKASFVSATPLPPLLEVKGGHLARSRVLRLTQPGGRAKRLQGPLSPLNFYKVPCFFNHIEHIICFKMVKTAQSGIKNEFGWDQKTSTMPFNLSTRF